jgi:hypothetical protein
MKGTKRKQKKPSRIQKLSATVRQLAQPPEFRIQTVAWSPEILELLEKLAGSMQPEIVPSGFSEREEAASYQELMSFLINLLADVGTGLWRLRQKMVEPGTEQPLDEMRRAFRHLESTWDVLLQAGVEILDHTGEPVPEGGIYALKAIAYEKTPGINREQVVETVKPSIYFRKQMIQMGEVVIGTPII